MSALNSIPTLKTDNTCTWHISAEQMCYLHILQVCLTALAYTSGNADNNYAPTYVDRRTMRSLERIALRRLAHLDDTGGSYSVCSAIDLAGSE